MGEPGRQRLRLTGFWLLGVPGPLVLACGVLTGLCEYVRVQVLVAGLTLAGLVGLVERQFSSGLLTLAVASWLVLTTHGLGQLTTTLRRSAR